jgi:NADH-quinone oxidoreductase subunit J
MTGQAAFLALAVITLGGAVGVVVARSVFVSALWLILSFVGVAGMYVLLQASFLAVIQILIYVGAISVLILFAVMLTRQVMTSEGLINRQAALSMILAVTLFGFLAVIAYTASWPIQAGHVLPSSGGTLVVSAEASPEAPIPAALPRQTADGPSIHIPGPIAMLGRAFVTDHVLAFEVISIILLVALIGAIVIARE